MSIVASSDFQGELQIANKSQEDVSADLTWFITNYEPEYLKNLLGTEFATLFIAGLAADPVEQRWTDLVTPELKRAIASYVFYWYIRDQDTQTVGVGQAKSNAVNATVVSAGAKLVKAWFKMVCLGFEIVRGLVDNDTYPEFVTPYWWSLLYAEWFGWNWDYQFFSSPWFYAFYSRVRIPDIFIPINTMNI